MTSCNIRISKKSALVGRRLGLGKASIWHNNQVTSKYG